MSEEFTELYNVLKMLDDLSALNSVLLVGSWVELLYDKFDILNNYVATVKTNDIDILIKNRKVPTTNISLEKAASELGYYIKKDYMTSCTKIYSPSGLEIEFLLGKQGAGRELSMKTCSPHAWG